MVTMATVVKVTGFSVFFRLLGPKVHLHAKFRENRAKNLSVKKLVTFGALETLELYYNR